MSAKEPTASKRLLSWLDYHLQTGAPLPPNTEQAIVAIAAEARHATLERVREGVERLPTIHGHLEHVQLAAVLALLDELDHA